MRSEPRNQRNLHFRILSRLSKFLNWQKWEKERESGNGEQNRGRRETSEKHRRKLCLQEIKFGTFHELEEWKAIVTSLGDGLQDKKAWNFIPSRWQQILKLYSGRQRGMYKTKPFSKCKKMAHFLTNSTLYCWLKSICAHSTATPQAKCL